MRETSPKSTPPEDAEIDLVEESSKSNARPVEHHRRYRCTQCDRVVAEDTLTEHPLKELILKMAHTAGTKSDKAEQLYHRVQRTFGGRRGRYGGMRTVIDSCGPVVPEYPSDYLLALEHFIGEVP